MSNHLPPEKGKSAEVAPTPSADSKIQSKSPTYFSHRMEILPQTLEMGQKPPPYFDNDIERLICHARRLAQSDPDNDHCHWTLLWIFQGIDLERRRRKLQETITDEI